MPSSLFTPTALGEIALANRVVMAPMTRDRAGPGDVPTDLMVEYYAQRARAGLVVPEGVQPCAVGKGYWRTPGIHSEEQIAGWRKVADAVHARGGRIVMHLMHCGRVVVAANRGFDADVIAPSAVPCPTQVPGPDGVPADCVIPRAITRDEIPALVAEYVQAARNAVAAGMDGVELHCASGYLINQFLNPASNHRTDEYGGPVENRIRLPIAVRQAMADAIGPIIATNNLKAESAAALLDTGRAEAVSFGRAFIANPDLVERIAAGAPLAKPDFSLLYTGEERGYTDYPAWAG